MAGAVNSLNELTSVRCSGSLQGAGGIGGLLARTDMGRLTVNDPLASAYYHADGNGNITALITGLMDTNQVLVAKYLYDSYGNLLAESGPLAGANKYRFSSKEWDSPAGLYYYLYRFYDPNLQRWPNRDPLGELGFLTRSYAKQLPMLLNYKSHRLLNGIVTPAYNQILIGDEDDNLYEFVASDPTERMDTLGLGDVWPGPYPAPGQSWDPTIPGNPPLPPPPSNCSNGIGDCIGKFLVGQAYGTLGEGTIEEVIERYGKSIIKKYVKKFIPYYDIYSTASDIAELAKCLKEQGGG